MIVQYVHCKDRTCVGAEEVSKLWIITRKDNTSPTDDTRVQQIPTLNTNTPHTEQQRKRVGERYLTVSDARAYGLDWFSIWGVVVHKVINFLLHAPQKGSS